MTDDNEKVVDDEYRAALLEGMERSRAVSRYLEALSDRRPRRGRKRAPERIRERLAEIDAEIERASGLTVLRMMQEQKNLRRELEIIDTSKGDLAALESDFVKHAKAVAEKDHIEYSTWVDYGVPRRVLQKAGIKPSTRRRGELNGDASGR